MVLQRLQDRGTAAVVGSEHDAIHEQDHQQGVGGAQATHHLAVMVGSLAYIVRGLCSRSVLRDGGGPSGRSRPLGRSYRRLGHFGWRCWQPLPLGQPLGCPGPELRLFGRRHNRQPEHSTNRIGPRDSSTLVAESARAAIRPCGRRFRAILILGPFRRKMRISEVPGVRGATAPPDCTSSIPTTPASCTFPESVQVRDRMSACGAIAEISARCISAGRCI